MGVEPSLDCCCEDILVLLGSLRQAEQRCQFGTARQERITGGGIHPEHSMVRFTEAIGVLDSGLGFADPTQAADGLRLDEGCDVGREMVMEVLEQFLTSGEKG